MLNNSYHRIVDKQHKPWKNESQKMKNQIWISALAFETMILQK